MAVISTKDLSALADPLILRSLMQSLAALDAIVSQEWEYRYFSFNSRWNENEMMGSIRNGQGDDIFALFNSSGVFIKGFDHELWDQDKGASADFYKDVPSCFRGATIEPAFSTQLVTFCCWRTLDSKHWIAAETPAYLRDADGSEWMLSMLDGDPISYLSFSENYYELLLDSKIVSRIHAGVPISRDLANSLNPQLDYRKLVDDLQEIAYPIEAE